MALTSLKKSLTGKEHNVYNHILGSLLSPKISLRLIFL